MFVFLKKIPDWVIILFAGLLSIAAFPPCPLGFLAYFCLIPIFYVLIRADFQLCFEKGYLYGIVLNLGIIYWLAVNKGTQWYWATLSMISAVLFLALNYGLIFFLIGIIGRRRVSTWSGRD